MADLTELSERIAREPVAATPPRQLIDQAVQRRRRRRVPTGVVAFVVATGAVLGGFALANATDGDRGAGTSSAQRQAVGTLDTSAADAAEVPTAPAVAPAPDPATFPGVDLCRRWIEQLRTEHGPSFPPFDPSAADEIVVLPLPASPAAVQVLLLADEGSYACRVLRSATPDDGHVSLSVHVGEALTRPDRTSILPLHGTWTGAPPKVEVMGRVGSAVTALELRLPDGTVLPGHITDDWFVIDGDITAHAASVGGGTVAWTLEDGKVVSAGLDALLTETSSQQIIDRSVPVAVGKMLAGDELPMQRIDPVVSGWDRAYDVDGVGITHVRRLSVEETREFLASEASWFCFDPASGDVTDGSCPGQPGQVDPGVSEWRCVGNADGTGSGCGPVDGAHPHLTGIIQDGSDVQAWAWANVPTEAVVVRFVAADGPTTWQWPDQQYVVFPNPAPGADCRCRLDAIAHDGAVVATASGR